MFPAEKPAVVRRLLDELTNVPQANIPLINQTTDLTRLILELMDGPLPTDIADEVVSLTLNGSDSLLKQALGANDSFAVTFKAIKETAKNLLDTLSDLQEQQPPKTYLIEPSTTEEYPDYQELNAALTERRMAYAGTTKKSIGAIENILKAIGARQPIDYEGTKIKNSAFEIAVVTQETKPTGIVGTEDGKFGVKMSDELMKALNDQHDFFTLQVLVCKPNLLWWHAKEHTINTDFLVVQLQVNSLNEARQGNPYRDANERASLTEALFDLQLPEPIDTLHKVHLPDAAPEPATESFSYEDGELGHALEARMPSYRVPVDDGDRTFVIFEPMEDLEISVVFTFENRPSIEDFDSPRRIDIPSKETNWTAFAQETSDSDDALVYLAILPGYNAWKNNTLFSNETLTVLFTIYKANCRIYNPHMNEMTTKDSDVGILTTPEMSHCRSKHLSVFGTRLYVVPNVVDPFRDAYLFLHIGENVVIVVFATLALLLFCLLLLFALWKDRKDQKRMQVVLLADNFPSHDYMYVISVFTGFRLTSKTTANIAIQLVGSNYKSYPHILRHPDWNAFERRSNAMFGLFTHGSLGDLLMIRIWHDNTGPSPSWYCDRVEVHDIETKQMWTFLVRRWLSLHKGHGNLYYIVQHPTPKEMIRFRVMYGLRLDEGLADRHNWLGPFWSRPSDGPTRCQRVGLLFQVLFLGMLANIAFFGIPRNSPEDQIYLGSLTISISSILIAVETNLVIIPITLGTALLFRRTRRAHPLTIQFVQALPSGGSRPLPQMVQVTETSSKRCSCMLPSPFRFIAWVICLSSILISAYLIMLYGLSYGALKSYAWVVSVVTAFTISGFLTQPFTIILYALVLTWLMKCFPRGQTLAEKFPLTRENLYPESPKSRRQFLQDVQNLRTKPMYRPPSFEQYQIQLHEVQRRTVLRQLLISLLLHMVYALCLFIILLSTRNPNSYEEHRAFRNLFVKGKFKDIAFNDFLSDERFYKYLTDSFIPVLHGPREVEVQEPGWNADLCGRLLGIARLRQVRVRKGLCKIPAYLQNFTKECTVPYSQANEDMENHGLRWKDLEDPLDYLEASITSPWVYYRPSTGDSWTVEGAFGWYRGQGYVATLGRTRNNSLRIVSHLKHFQWIDAATRAVMIEFTTYNAYDNLFNVALLLAERTPFGSYTTRTYVETVTLLQRSGDATTLLVLAVLVFVLMVVLLVCYQMNCAWRAASHQEQYSWWNIVDITIVLFGIGVVVLYVVRNTYVAELIRELGETDNNEFVSFYGAAHLDFLLTVLLTLLVCACTARLWKVLRFGKQFRYTERTLFLAKGSLFVIAFMYIVFLVGFTSIAYQLLHTESDFFASFSKSVMSMLLFGLGFDIDFDFTLIYQIHHFFGPFMYALFGAISIVIALNLFITVLVYTYENTKYIYSMKNLRLCSLLRNNLKIFILSGLSKLGIKAKRGKRLRGGSDQPDSERRESISRKPRNRVSISEPRLRAMVLLAAPRPKEEIRNEAMAALVWDLHTDDSTKKAVFYQTLDETNPLLVPAERIYAIEEVIARLLTERHDDFVKYRNIDPLEVKDCSERQETLVSDDNLSEVVSEDKVGKQLIEKPALARIYNDLAEENKLNSKDLETLALYMPLEPVEDEVLEEQETSYGTYNSSEADELVTESETHTTQVDEASHSDEVMHLERNTSADENSSIRQKSTSASDQENGTTQEHEPTEHTYKDLTGKIVRNARQQVNDSDLEPRGIIEIYLHPRKTYPKQDIAAKKRRKKAVKRLDTRRQYNKDYFLLKWPYSDKPAITVPFQRSSDNQSNAVDFRSSDMNMSDWSVISSRRFTDDRVSPGHVTSTRTVCSVPARSEYFSKRSMVRHGHRGRKRRPLRNILSSSNTTRKKNRRSRKRRKKIDIPNEFLETMTTTQADKLLSLIDRAIRTHQDSDERDQSQREHVIIEILQQLTINQLKVLVARLNEFKRYIESGYRQDERPRSALTDSPSEDEAVDAIIVTLAHLTTSSHSTLSSHGSPRMVQYPPMTHSWSEGPGPSHRTDQSIMCNMSDDEKIMYMRQMGSLLHEDSFTVLFPGRHIGPVPSAEFVIRIHDLPPGHHVRVLLERQRRNARANKSRWIRNFLKQKRRRSRVPRVD